MWHLDERSDVFDLGEPAFQSLALRSSEPSDSTLACRRKGETYLVESDRSILFRRVELQAPRY